MLDENISRKDHIKTIEKRLTENIGLLYRAKPYLDETSLKPYILHILFHI